MLFAPPNWDNSISVARPGFGFPKTVRILRRSDFRKVYDEGFRHSCRFFAAFCFQIPEQSVSPPSRNALESGGPRIGFTVSRAMGKSVTRNRMRRRMREAVRLNLALLPAPWAIVLNPRRPVLDANFEEIQTEVRRLFAVLAKRCANS
ncbi:MAG: ribonuclease P protein component [Bryobacteraceae bacterium]|nr:ribonuclease P protein component [Bryobacteraceae bacterium]